MASPRNDADDVASDDYRVAIWEELEQEPLPSLSTPSPPSSQPSSPVVSAGRSRSSSAPRVDPSSSPLGSVAPVASAKSLGGW
ncbi:hypothetical protein PF011_g23063 [Phytophthora fragariae]|uniref:Uncharacterized protein n=1 Tax=Phytophthora fragariae TaxID=53985 RepID=A0A6A3I9S9_9STRA|nr:hypothetical protein PF003_g27766 [Phytophthora fragariae]KAE8978880.1 hypothetical protein PF011_g23063 [Phytophthora fragariae]